jgi:hypothetical protein
MTEEKIKLTLRERTVRHKKEHPNDKGLRKHTKGVKWVKPDLVKELMLERFYQTHEWVSGKDILSSRWVLKED